MSQNLPILYRQIIPVTSKAFALAASPLSFNVPRESVVDQINLYIEGTIGTAAATAAVEGLPRLIKSVTVRGSLSGAPELVPIQGLTGPDLFEAAQFQKNSLPQVFGALGSTGKFRVNIPLYFREFYLSNELKNLLTALPAFACSDLTVTVTPGTQADVDTNGSPAFVLTSAICGLEVFQYYRSTLPSNMQFARGTFEVLQDDTLSTNNAREVKLPSGGLYSFILARAWGSATAKQANGGASPFTETPGTLKLYDLSRYVKMETDFLKLRAENLSNLLDAGGNLAGTGLVDGNACLLFNRQGETGLFQTGQLGAALNNVTLVYDCTNASNAFIRFVYRRIFDDANLLGL